MRNGRILSEKVQNEQSQVQYKLMKAAMAIFTHGNGMKDIDALLLHEEGNDCRAQVHEISLLLRFIYIMDPVLERDEWAKKLCDRFMASD